MYQRPIRNSYSEKSPGERFCDVIIDGDEVILKSRVKGSEAKIKYDDLCNQVDIAKQMAQKRS